MELADVVRGMLVLAYVELKGFHDLKSGKPFDMNYQ
jgi:hypothetical protein